MSKSFIRAGAILFAALATFRPVLAQQSPAPATAQEINDLRTEVEQLKEQVKALQEKLDALMAAAPAPAAPGAPTPPPAVPPGPEAAPPPEAPPVSPAPAQAAPQASNYFNPSISVIGNFLAAGGSNDTAPLPAASLSESEVSFQAVVDPYARADFFFSYGEEGVEVEEGFATFTALPWGLLSKVGRMRVSFGKVNTLHLHVLPWPDEPLPISDLLGNEDGWIATGASFSKVIPMGQVYSELTLQAFDGNATGLFDAPSRGDLAYNGQYRIFTDLTESTNLDVGFSYALGPNGLTDSSDTRLENLYTVFRWKPLRTATYRSFIFRGEFLRSHKEELAGSVRSDGWFASADYQMAKRWWIGGRYEVSELPDDATLEDRGEAATLTFFPSEFLEFRGMYRRRHYFNDDLANEFLLQIQFAIGAHGAHPF